MGIDTKIVFLRRMVTELRAIKVSDIALGGHLEKKYFPEVGFWRTFFLLYGTPKVFKSVEKSLVAVFLMLGLFFPYIINALD